MTALTNISFVNAALNAIGTAGYHISCISSTLESTVVPAVAASMAFGFDVKKGVLQGIAASAVGPWVVKPFLAYVERNTGVGFDKISDKAKKFFRDAEPYGEAGLPFLFTYYASDALFQFLSIDTWTPYGAEYTAFRGVVTACGILLGKHLIDNQEVYKKMTHEQLTSAPIKYGTQKANDLNQTR